MLIAAIVAGDGQSNWFKGLLLLLVYALFACSCWFLPDSLPAAG